jgi:hypothetical protein
VDAQEKSFDAAAEASKLLISLASGGVAAGIALVNVEVGKSTVLAATSCRHRYAIAAALLALLVSLGCGIWTQLAITQVLAESTKELPANVWDRKITVPFKIQIAVFMVGIAAFVGYGVIRLAA